MTDGKNDKPADSKADEPEATKPAAAKPEAGKPQPSAAGPGKGADAKPGAAGKPEAGTKPGGQSAAAKPEPAKGGGAGSATGPKKPSGGGKGGGLAVVLVLLVAVAGALGGWYLWQQLQALQARQAALAEAGQIQALQQRLDQEQQARQALEQQLASAREQAAQSARQAAEATDNLGQLRQTQEQIQDRLGRIAQLADTSRDEWIRSEAAYLANIAVHRLRFMQDVDAALGALQAADNLLAELGAQSLGRRRAIKQAVDQLMTVDLPNYDRLASRLGALIDVIPQLPLAATRLREVAGAEEVRPEPAPLPEDAGWQARLERAWDQFTDSLAELVVIEPDQGAVPLVAPDQRYYLRQNLMLQLQVAQQALLEGNAELYRSSLQRAQEWLRTYFDQDAPAVVAALEELARLQRVQVDPELPDISGLLESLKMFE